MSSNKYKILIIEDDNAICSFVKTTLEANGYQVIVATTCQQGMLMSASHVPDLIVLDLGLPDKDGLELIKAVRRTSLVPILVLSARTMERDKVIALDMGANDYVTKPFGTMELVARVRAALRSRRGNDIFRDGFSGKFQLHDLTIDYDRRLVTVGEKEVKLTQTEYNILAFLSVHTGKVLTYSAIIGNVWGHIDEGSTKKLQVNMANIRKKLDSKPGDNRYIINELGVGYRMQDA